MLKNFITLALLTTPFIAQTQYAYPQHTHSHSTQPTYSTYQPQPTHVVPQPTQAPAQPTYQQHHYVKPNVYTQPSYVPPTPPSNNLLLQSVLQSLLGQASTQAATQTVSPVSFLDQWNAKFGYNFMSLESVRQNISCRARCRSLTESPVCGVNMTRYFNSCDAECDQVTYSTDNLKYNKRCCCSSDMMSLVAGNVYCVVQLPWVKGSTSLPKMVVNGCILNCLQKSGNMITQGTDSVVGC